MGLQLKNHVSGPEGILHEVVHTWAEGGSRETGPFRNQMACSLACVRHTNPSTVQAVFNCHDRIVSSVFNDLFSMLDFLHCFGTTR